MVRVLGAVLVPALLAFGAVMLAERVVGDEPGRGQGIVWGGSAHTTKEEQAAWLRQRGVAYEVWAERHPVAAARLEGRGEEREWPALPSPGTIARSSVGLLFQLAALLLLAVALLPTSRLPAAVGQRAAGIRFELGAAGTAIVLALVIAQLGV